MCTLLMCSHLHSITQSLFVMRLTLFFRSIPVPTMRLMCTECSVPAAILHDACQSVTNCGKDICTCPTTRSTVGHFLSWYLIWNLYSSIIWYMLSPFVTIFGNLRYLLRIGP